MTIHLNAHRHKVIWRKKMTLNIFEFNELINNSEVIYTKSEKKFFVDVRKKGNLVLFHMIRFHCRECDEECDDPSITTILDLIETILHQKLLISRRRIEESTCETDYYFTFLIK